MMNESNIQTREQLLREVANLKGEIEDLQESAKKLNEKKDEFHQGGLEWKSTFDAISDSVCIIDTNGKINQYNSSTLSLLGVKKNDINKKYCYQLVHGTSEPYPDCPLIRSRKSKQTESMVFKKGKRWLKVTVDPIINTKGEIIKSVHIVSDITDQIESYNKLQKEMLFSESLFQASPAYIVVIGKDGKTLLVNNSFLNALGYKQEEILGKDYMTTLVPDRDHEKLSKIFAKLVKQKTPTLNENYVKTKDGRELLVEWHGRSIYKNNNEYDSFFGIGIDISERKEVREEMEKLALIVNYSKELVSLSTLEGRMTYLNDSGCKMLGIEPHEVENVNIKEIFHPNMWTKAKKEILPILLEGRTWEGDLQYRNIKTGKLTDVLAMTFPLKNPETGELQFLANVSLDITERKQTEELLQASEKKFSSAFQYGPVIMAITNLTDGKFIEINNSFSKSLGYSVDEVIGKTNLELNFWTDIKKRIEMVETIEKYGYIRDFEIDVNTKSGEIRTLLFSAVLLNIDKKTIIISTGNDITESKLLEEKQSENERLLLRIAENYPNSYVSIIEKDFTVGFTSGQEFKNQNLDPNHFIGLSLEQVFGDNVSVVKKHYKKTFQGKEQSFELRINDQHQHYRSLPLYAEDGSVPRILAVAENITERKLADQKILKQLNQNKQILETTQDGYILGDSDGIIIDVNPSYCEMTGYSREELLKMNIRDVEVKIPKDEVDRRIKQMIKLGRDRFVTKHKRKDGQIIDLDTSVSILEIDQKPMVAAFMRDITKRMQMEEALRKSEYRFRMLTTDAPVGIFEADGHGNAIFVNETVVSYTGLPLDKHLGTGWISAIHPDDKERVSKLWMDTISKKNSFETEFRFVDTSNKVTWVASHTTKLKDAKGLVTGFMSTLTDITDRKKFEQDIFIAKQRAEESDRLKSAFLANMSHEIRTPMNGIMGFASLLKEPKLTGEKQQNFIKIIEENGERLLNIINDLIDISKIEAGQMNVSVTEVNINEQIEQLYSFFKPEVEEKKLQLFFKNPLPALEAIIKTDRDKFYAIFSNLIKNSIKYTNEGSIEFGYQKNGSNLEFYVKDTGIGISNDKQQSIFKRFVQADHSLTNSYDGAGLGLSISEAFVKMLDGKIWVESEEKKGSQFHFTIPYNPINEVLRTTKDEVTMIKEKKMNKNLNILIVEDEEFSDLLLVEVTKNISNEVLHAKNGIEAVEICRKNKNIDVVLMDIRMPEMDGYEATRKIREFNKKLIIIAQTAFALKGDREKALKAGCNEYLPKPIKETELFKIIDKTLMNN